jgi:endoribonuclease Dicer
VVQRFRTGEVNLVVATNIGNEGMDFKQCQLVTAFEPPPNITNYIQARGRARKEGSKYCWFVPESQPERSKEENRRDMLVM